MTPDRHLTVSDLVDGYGGYSRSTVQRWIRNGKLKAEHVDGKLVVPVDANRELLISMLYRPQGRRLAVWAPDDLPDYSRWHDALDCLVWLLLVLYAPRESLKSKQPRLDQTLAGYLRDGNVNVPRIKRAFLNARNPSRARASKDLQRGWYHELAFCFPLRPETLLLSSRAVTDSISMSAERFLFPTWRIVAAYYSAYFLIRTTADLKSGAFRTEEHQSAIRTFKSNVAGPLGNTLWRYPFSLEARRHSNSVLISPPFPKADHFQFAYSCHPRDPKRSPSELHEVLVRLYKRRLRGLSAESYGLLDLLRDLRVWANYQDVDNLLKLRSGAFKAYLDRNLSVLLFFVATMAELSYLAVCGTKAYLRYLQTFYSSVTTSNDLIRRAFPSMPVVQRLEVYRQLGLISGELRFTSDTDPHRVQPDLGAE